MWYKKIFTLLLTVLCHPEKKLAEKNMKKFFNFTTVYFHIQICFILLQVFPKTGWKESQFYSLLFGQAVANMY